MVLSEASNEFYHSIIEHNPDAVFVLTLNGEIIQINHMVTKVFGYSEKEAQRVFLQDLIHPKQEEEFEYHITQVLKGDPSEIEFDAYHKNGRILHLRIKSIPLTEKTEIVGVFCEVKDLSEIERTKQIEQVFKNFFNSSADAFDIVDLAGNILDVNPSFESLYGWGKEEVLGKPLPIIPEYRLTESKSFMEKAKKGETIKGVQVSGIRKDSTPIEVSLTYSPLQDVNGNIIALSGIARDVTEIKKLEMSLKESEERYRKLMEYIPKGVIVHRKGKVLYANPAALNVLKETNLKDQCIYSYVHPDFLDSYKNRISQIEAGNELPFIEIKMVQKDGTVIFVEMGGVSIQNNGDSVMLTIFRDITDRIKMEQELRDSEERYRLLADNSIDLIQLVDLDGIVTYASPSHQSVLGYDPEEYLGKWVYYQPGTGIDEQFKDTFLTMAVTHQAFTCEIVRKHKKGHEVWIELKGTPMFDKERSFKYMMMIGREITERKKLQTHLEYLSYHDPLTGIPNRRLFKERLEQALKEANRYQHKLVVMYMDMDKFKQINDNLGHEIGDKLLKEFSKRVKSHLRESDTFARQGGDEFTILLSRVPEESVANKVAERILASLQEPWDIEGHVFQTTSSIGIAVYPKDGVTRNGLLKHADTALYKAKKDGRNNFRTYSSF